MSLRKHRRTLEALFSHPINTNLEWKDIEHMLVYLGFEVDITKKHHAKIKGAQGEEVVVILPHHESQLYNPDEVVKIRHFLEAQGVTPATLKKGD